MIYLVNKYGLCLLCYCFILVTLFVIGLLVYDYSVTILEEHLE